MALSKCKECGEQVSTKAKVCPKCGAPAPKKTSAGTWFVLVLVLFTVYLCSQTPTPSVGSRASTEQSVASSSAQENAAPPQPSWGFSDSKDEMTGVVSWYASSPVAAPTKKMGFPYHDVEAWLGVGCDGKSEWAYVGSTVLRT